MNSARNSWRLRLLVLAILALGLLSPYWRTGYYMDDSINSMLPAALQLKQQGIGDFIREQILHWITQTGRLFPLALGTGYGFWYLLPDLASYRLLQLSLVLGNLAGFHALVRQLGGTRRLAIAATMLALASFQLRAYHDPISSYAGLMQINLGLGLGSLLLLGAWQRRERSAALWGSLGLYLATLLTYETGLAFLPILVHASRRTSGTQQAPVGFSAMLARYGHLAVTALYLAATFSIRAIYVTGYAGTRPQPSLRALSTLIYQLSAAVPLSYPFFGRSGFYAFKTLFSPEVLNFGTAGIFALATLLSYWNQTSESPLPAANPTPPQLGALRTAGWSLFVLPACFVALSEKYQHEVNLIGLGYLPVYLSCFGLALLIALRLERVRRGTSAAFLAAGFGAVAGLTYSTNRIAAERLNDVWKYPRILMERALQDGLLSDVRPGSSLLLMPSQLWATRELIRSRAGIEASTANLEQTRTEPLPPPSTRHSYLLFADATGEGNVFLIPLRAVHWDARTGQLLGITPAGAIRTAKGCVPHWPVGSMIEFPRELLARPCL